MTGRLATAALVTVGGQVPHPALAAPALDGAALPWPWALPFLGLLLSIATGPLLFPQLWHKHYGKIVFLWSAITLAALAALHGEAATFAALLHTMLTEYLSFIIVLFALYVVAGGILITGKLRGTPVTNAIILAVGALMASVVGTTGAAMILIRPLLRANARRVHDVHVFVFFTILVANIGGALSPLGDPPLFIGFLRGVDFFWTTRELLFETVLVAGLVLAIFIVIDVWYYRKDRRVAIVGESDIPDPIRLRGGANFILIALIIGVMMMSATWNPGVVFDVYATPLELQKVVRDAALLVIAGLSIAFTPDEHREANGFTWEPIFEVAKLFAGIFVCIIPVLTMLRAGRDGAFAWLLSAVTDPSGRPHDIAYFWLTGGLSAFLDNAPTYLVFFELSGGDAQTLMGPFASTLAAISMGAVYMGALTYIGNAPNFMIYAIATERGVKMPSFFGYMRWSMLILIPVFVLLTAVSVARL